MKWIFYFIFNQLFFYNIVIAENNGIFIEWDDNAKSWEPGVRIEIECKGSNKNQKIQWVDPSGQVVDRRQSNSRVYVQEILSSKGAVPVQLLVITHAVVADTGVWGCRDGSFEKTVDVCVIDGAVFINSKRSIEVDAGGAITLICEAQGHPEPRLFWYRDGEVITDEDLNTTSKYKLTTKYNPEGFEGLLTILSLEPEDAGVYVCEAVQQFPQYPYCSFNGTDDISLIINHKPIMEYDINETMLIYGTFNQTVQINCSAHSNPLSTYKWYIQYSLFDKEVPDYMVQHYNNGTTLTVQANQSTYFNRYKCIASNSYGESYNLFKLVPGIKPEAPEITIVNITDTTILIELKIENMNATDHIEIMYEYMSRTSDNPYKEAGWKYVDTVHVNKSGGVLFSTLYTETIILFDLEPQTKYQIRARTINVMGHSDWSQPIVATTEPIEENNIDEEISYYYDDIYGLIRIMGVATIAALIFLIVMLLRKNEKEKKSEANAI